MQSFLLLLFTFFFSTVIYAQDLKKGRILDHKDGSGIPRAHIQNLTQQKFTVSNEEGFFQLPVTLGDSLWISCIGYRSTGYIVKEQWMGKPLIEVPMAPDTILLDAITIYKMPSERQFKQKILDYQPSDTSFQVFGLPEEFNLPLEDYSSNEFSLYRGRSPFGALYSTFSKKEKEKRKMVKILSRQRNQSVIKEKFNREIVAQLTQLEGDELTDFISFCDFKEDFLLNSSQLQIAEAIAEKYQNFIKSREI